MDPGRLYSALIALGLLAFAPVASAAEVSQRLDNAAKAIVDEDYARAQVALANSEEHLGSLDKLVTPAILARYWMLRGAVAWRTGADPDDDLRQALIVDPDARWDTKVVADNDLRSLFEALRREVRERDTVDLRVPEATGEAQVWVDGRRRLAGDTAPRGLHLAQVSCPDGTVVSAWSTLQKKTKYLDWCPEKVDTSIVVAPPPPEDPFGMPDFTPVDPGDDVELAPADLVVEPVPPDPDPVEGGEGESVPGLDDAGGGRSTGYTTALVAGGGALVISATVVNFTVVQPTWADIEAARATPASVGRADADALTSRFNTARALTLALAGAGISAAGAGVLLGAEPVLVPGGVGLRARF